MRLHAILIAFAMGLVACKNDYRFTDYSPQAASCTADRIDKKDEEPKPAPVPMPIPRPHIPEPEPPPKPQPLHRKTTGEILDLKYESAILTCELRMQEGTALNLKANPVDKFTWDLLKDPSPNKTFRLKGKSRAHSGDFDVKVSAVKILGFVHYANQEATYKMESSLVMKLEFSSKEKVDQGGVVSQVSGSGSVDAHELIRTKLVAESYLVEGDALGLFTDLSCILQTRVKPDYKDQLIVEDPETN